MIVNHNHPAYASKFDRLQEPNKYNGAYYYSKEITDIIIPRVSTDRSWVTVNIRGYGCNHAIVFIHNNLNPQNYDWMRPLQDLILVCGIESTMEKVSHLGTPIYLPLSVDVSYVEKFKTKKTEEIAYAGRPGKRRRSNFPPNTTFLEGLPRERFLTELAKYKKVYAVGRVAIEAQILGCEVLPYDERYPDPSVWKILDSKDAAALLQKEIHKIDGA